MTATYVHKEESGQFQKYLALFDVSHLNVSKDMKDIAAWAQKL